MTSYSGTELPWTGGRPWRILDECPAATHNALNSGRGRIQRRNAANDWVTTRVTKCICPGAIFAIALDNAERRKRAVGERDRGLRASRFQQGSGEVRKSRAGAWVPDGVKMPNFENAACRNLLGRRIMDNVINSSGGSNTRAVKQAKGLCAICPIRETLCGPYILAAEKPTGSWYGVWAGMTQAERRAAQGLTR